jgi:hypothetical protein
MVSSNSILALGSAPNCTSNRTASADLAQWIGRRPKSSLRLGSAFASSSKRAISRRSRLIAMVSGDSPVRCRGASSLKLKFRSMPDRMNAVTRLASRLAIAVCNWSRCTNRAEAEVAAVSVAGGAGAPAAACARTDGESTGAQMASTTRFELTQVITWMALFPFVPSAGCAQHPESKEPRVPTPLA